MSRQLFLFVICALGLGACNSQPTLPTAKQFTFKKERVPTSFSEHAFTCEDPESSALHQLDSSKPILKVSLQIGNDEGDVVRFENLKTYIADSDLQDQQSYVVRINEPESASGESMNIVGFYKSGQGDEFQLAIPFNTKAPPTQPKRGSLSIRSADKFSRGFKQLICCNESLKPQLQQNTWTCQ